LEQEEDVHPDERARTPAETSPAANRFKVEVFMMEV
jgi:hypothetical protein